MHATTATTLTAVSAAWLLLGACGVSDDPEPLTKAEFVEQANSICADFQTAVTPVFETIWDGVGEGDAAVDELIFVRWAEAIDQLGPEFDRMLDRIRDLEPPEADREVVEALLDDQESALEEFTGIVDAAADGDTAARAAMEREDFFSDVDRRAREYGLTVCADG